MDILKKASPVVRGQCDACGTSRNLWLNELGKDVPCHCRSWSGCRGSYSVVYQGPQAWIPQELHNVRCRCQTEGQGSAAAACAAPPSELVQQLVAMGFPQTAAAQAERQCKTTEDAVEWLTSTVPGGRAVEQGNAQAATTQAATTQSASAATWSGGSATPMDDEEVGECAICCEDLNLADAAMRCLGDGGRKHYFHASCLAAWIRQCQRDGAEATCPNCRGPVQVRAHRLEEFLQDKRGQLSAEDSEALRTFQGSLQGSSDGLGWSDVKPHLWKVGVAAGVIGLGVALAFGVSAFNKSRDDRRDRRG